ncbi:metal-dependent hydrolase [Nocardiaceae bacterium YC2-7]|uniref:Metal-dependent hydrolase n=2 Tax=Antrihabitans stalactiti TaxID=2584121 RepID=A0A848KH48_9NOCA|nr:metal-dependent hydrolase [Antrihabitans stalactiti]NMN95510.1 metal-dependent hydrolase [Antrihabitans stalactiti]
MSVTSILRKEKTPLRTAKDTTPPKVRRMRFRFGEAAPMEHLFINGNIPLSHGLALGNAAIPLGEETMLRAVKKFMKDIDDPVLKKRVVGFVGQELVHSQEHDRLNDEHLANLRYPVANSVMTVLREGTKSFKALVKIEDFAGVKLHMGVTAMLEHITATLGRRMLSNEELYNMPGADPEALKLLTWHALEELEHKSVMFDAYRYVGGSEIARIGSMAVVVVGLYPVLGPLLLLSILRDRDSWHPLIVARQAIEVARGPLLKGLLGELAEFMRPGFHPDDIDTEDLVQEWQLKLFGANGELVDRLR